MPTEAPLLDAILEAGRLTVVFQPIFEVREQPPALFGLECLIRGPRGTNAERPAVLFEYVRRKRAEAAVDRACVGTALAEAGRLPGRPRLSVNVHASTLGRDLGFPGFLLECAQHAGIEARRLVVEIVEHSPPLDVPGFRHALEALREAHVTIALDDVGLVKLGDGSFGILPEHWLERLSTFAGFGTRDGDRLRFRSTQIGVIDALLAAAPEASFDETVARARTAFQTFDGIEPHNPPRSFQGTLRPYQRDGLGWFDFLQRFGFGGCLADDMGLGKTVQVLALLAGRAAKAGPALVVAPNSVVHGWVEEAARFAPGLDVVRYTGAGRSALRERAGACDLVVTTYGTLRRDLDWLREQRFDTVPRATRLPANSTTPAPRDCSPATRSSHPSQSAGGSCAGRSRSCRPASNTSVGHGSSPP